MARFILPVNSGEPEGLAPRFHGFKLRASGGARRLTSCKINVRQLKFFQTINVRHMNSTPETVSDLSSHIAANIRDAIIKGVLIVDERLPSEAELSAQFNVSRATVREALKRKTGARGRSAIALQTTFPRTCNRIDYACGCFNLSNPVVSRYVQAAFVVDSDIVWVLQKCLCRLLSVPKHLLPRVSKTASRDRCDHTSRGVHTAYQTTTVLNDKQIPYTI